MIKLDIISDPICPWCYIAKAELDRALEAHPDHPFAIEWHPFQLNPNMPAEGVDRHSYMESKFGGKEGAVKAYAPIVERAEALGLGIDFAAIKRTPNTLDAHRMIHWAGLEGRQTAMVSALFAAYFREGRDIGAHEVLIDLGRKLDMDEEMTKRLLESDADKEAIRERDAHSREAGVSAVPTFILANQHVVPGAQPQSLWADVIADINNQQADL